MLAGNVVAVLVGMLSVEAANFRGGSKQIEKPDVLETLFSMLAANASQERINEIQRTMEPTFNAVPKTHDGHLGHKAMLYILHRWSIDQHGWFIKDLDSSYKAVPLKNAVMKPSWIPAYLHELLEKRFGESGVALHELAAVAATIEALVEKESMRRFEAIDKLIPLPKVVSVQEFMVRLQMFMLVFLRNERVPLDRADHMYKFLEVSSATLHGWGPTLEFVDMIFDRNAVMADNKNDYVDVHKSFGAFKRIGLQYHEFNDRQCVKLKRTLMDMEDAMPGRVRLSTFYNKSFFNGWLFTEKPDYLRSLGALEETDGVQRLIITNYVHAMPNCDKPSNLYSICCRNECEDLMTSLEREIAAPEAKAQTIIKLVSELASDTMPANRSLPQTLKDRLQKIEDMHVGMVPLHGRLFAQWMHHVYPRECPYPQISGSTYAQTADEWMKQNGVSSSFEMTEVQSYILNSTCSAGGDCAVSGKELSNELPWTEEEELPLVCRKSIAEPTVTFPAENARRQISWSWVSLLALVLVALWTVVQPEDPKVSAEGKGKKPEKIMTVVLMLGLTLIADPFFVACIVLPGFVAFKVVPRIQQEMGRRRKLQSLEQDGENNDVHFA